jgi:subtilisin family serine protease
MREEKSESSKGSWLRRFRDWLTGRRPEPPSSEPSATVGPHHASASPNHDGSVNPGYDLKWDHSWDDEGIGPLSALDPNFCLVVSLFEALDFEQLFRRTGIRVDHDGKMRNQTLPLFLELKERNAAEANMLPGLLKKLLRQGVNLRIAPAYFDEVANNLKLRHITGQLLLDDAEISSTSIVEVAKLMRDKLSTLIKTKEFARVSLPTPLQPCADDSLRDIDLPANRRFKASKLDGTEVIVGVIDDGCALAHPDFLIPGTHKSRIQYLWDATRADPTGGWTMHKDANGNPDFDGLELTNTAIDHAINGHISGGVIDQDKVYDYLQYPIEDLQSHGSHVTGIAAGNGRSIMGCEGVAPAADIIFVQLPTGLVEQGGPLLENSMLDGVKYIFSRAELLGKKRKLPFAAPVVINISYGGYSGPHDGTSPLASGIDERLVGQFDRAVVISAGNGFEADCHAMIQDLKPSFVSKPLRWILRPEDPTSNVLEVWYDGQAKLECSVTLPGAAGPLPPVGLGMQAAITRNSDGRIVGWISHVGTNNGFNLNYIRIFLLPTVGVSSTIWIPGPIPIPIPIPLTAPAPSGIWQVGFRNAGAANATFHAWIERDDSGKPSRAQRQQSHFDPADADPRYTLAGAATGTYAICVGAYNTGTQEVCRYSACGPTRDPRYDRKPDVCAPAEEDVAGHGVLCTSARRAQPTRMNGTSAAAPQVAGLVALMLQYNRDSGNPPLAADDIRAKIIAGAKAAQTLPPPPPRDLLANRHQDADDTRSVKQEDVWADLIGAGKVSVVETLKLL